MLNNGKTVLETEIKEDRNRPSPLLVTFLAMRKLWAKTMLELENPRQLLEPGRAEDLWKKGVWFLFSAFNKVDGDTERIRANMKELKEKNLPNRETVYWTGNKDIPIQILCFPPEAVLSFNYHPSSPLDSSNAHWTFAGPTQIQLIDKGPYVPAELGYFGPEATHPIPETLDKDQSQASGLFFSNNGHLRIVSFSEAKALFEKHEEGDRLVMLNWHLKSNNPREAFSHIDHWIRQPYNGIAFGRRADGTVEIAQITTSQELTVVKDEFSVEDHETTDLEVGVAVGVLDKLKAAIGLDADKKGVVSMPEIMATLELIAEKRGWTEFEALGTEYIEGDLRKGRGNYFGSYFAVNY